MFEPFIYCRRRLALTRKLSNGLVLLPGNRQSPMNSLDNCYPFRQDSSFLYFAGIDQPGFILLLDLENGDEILAGPRPTQDDLVWSGPRARLEELAEQVGIGHVETLEELKTRVHSAQQSGRTVHYLPSCREENLAFLASLLEISTTALRAGFSRPLIQALVALRSVKSAEEISELEAAAELGYELHRAAMGMAVPGLYEWEIAGELEALAARAGRLLSFRPIVTTHGEVLHNHQRQQRLKQGDLLLVDAGVESEGHYASDHTRTCPVGGRFSSRQRDVYAIVQAALERSRELIRPGVTYLEIHLDVCRTLTMGLRDLGLMHGEVDAAVAAGAHALFMPHGLGHMLGLDVHDMEELGEDLVGYDETIRRSAQFGLSRLRLGRELQPGFVLTAEPGIYFIPGLIEQWRAEGRHNQFINYSEVSRFLDFGGIRLEDDLLLTAEGNQLLGRPLPLGPDEVEALAPDLEMM